MATVLETSRFPSPIERPDAFVLIFDGQCNFCRANMRLLRSFDQGRVAYLSLHDPDVRQRWPELSHEELMKHIYLVNGDAKYAGAAAIRFLSRHLMGLWILAPLLHIPGSLPLWQFLYKFVAKHRYRMGRTEDCEGGSCSVHFD